MFIKKKRRWELPESAATPEHVFFNRRNLMIGAGVVGAGAIGAGVFGAGIFGAGDDEEIFVAQETDQTLDLYPAARNEAFTLDRAVTDETVASNYNNFYEFGSSKRVAAEAQALRTRPWMLSIDGLVEEPMEIDIDTLIRRMTLEERLYRFRCVEAWAMAVPWTGFRMADLVSMARPLSSAKYVVMQTFQDPVVAVGQRQSWYPWPYTEGLTIAEATNDLTLMVTGVYGKPIANQFGAPLRLITPWKYGFKCVKSIVKISFTEERPVSFWEELAAQEYGFWANVNPDVPHPRWSQATERMIGSNETRPTMLFNGYAEEVAQLYEGLEGERLFA
ncbi:MAG: protein-methionine-sulfoxide reductase catalytic subunit MsrP [Salinarimonadaceae bacterium]|nr:MAG: protein-methionine-sulfoxide reductase catalytic subunit MsrP [Salinarimonadaceae bacterium]